jgi:hypothetical protein
VSEVFPFPSLPIFRITHLGLLRPDLPDRCRSTTTTVRGRNESEPNL